jgi:glycosyltransferase involved in cell wall biosynthesis
MRILLLTYSLGVGGAESILVSMANALRQKGHVVLVVNLGVERFFEGQLRRCNAKVISLQVAYSTGSLFRKYLSVFRIFGSLLRVTRGFRPDLIHSWLYPADLLGGIIGKLCQVPVVWGIFSGRLDRKLYSTLTYSLIRLCGLLFPYLAKCAISCSAFGRKTHNEIGYSRRPVFYIPTGFDDFADGDDAAAGHRSGPISIGMLGRWTIEKRHDRLIQAVAQQITNADDLKLILAGGRGITYENSELAECIAENQLTKSVILLGSLEDTSDFWNKVDIFCLFSESEGLPTVVGEAMARRLPCLASDIGDARILLSDPNQLCNLADRQDIGRKLTRLIRMSESERKRLGRRNQRRIQTRFSTARMAERYEKVYLEVVGE